MRTADADILIVPGWSSSGEDHWQTRWERALKTARRVEQADWLAPDRQAWVAHIQAEIDVAQKPVVIVAHSLGVAAAVTALLAQEQPKVAGAFLVAPADVERAGAWPATQGFTFDPVASGFAHMPASKLPVPSAVVASSDDPYCTLERAEGFARAWGAHFHNAGAAGHINAVSGHGPWPEGLMQLGWFLRLLSAG